MPTVKQKEASRLTKEEWREYTKTVWTIANTSDPDHPAVFPIEIPKRLIKMYSFVGENVLDPFAGVGTTAEAALELKRKSIAVEQNKTYTARIRRGKAAALKSGALRVHTGDARSLKQVDDSSVGLIVTSPPYWNKADYGGNGYNVGTVEGYAEFLREIRPAFDEAFRVLQPGRKLAVVTANVNQYTDRGLLTFPLAADFIQLAREAGFALVGEVIWNKDGTGGRWGSYGRQRPIFGSYPFPPNLLFKTVHEHILVLAKPPAKLVRNKKALPYEELMQ
jgi:DNA modification methylase